MTIHVLDLPPRPGAGLWDLTSDPENVPVRAEHMLPGSHVVAATGAHQADLTGVALRRAGFEIRDSIVWHHEDGHTILLLARGPLTGTTVDNVITHGVGALNIDATRTPLGDADKAASQAKNAHEKFGSAPRENKVYGKDDRAMPDWSGELGRFPTNLLLQHSQGCTPIGTAMQSGDARGAAVQAPGRRPGGFVDTGARSGDSAPNGRLYPDARVTVYDCQWTCPVRELDATTATARDEVGGASRYFPRFTRTEQVWEWLRVLIAPPGVSVHARFADELQSAAA